MINYRTRLETTNLFRYVASIAVVLVFIVSCGGNDDGPSRERVVDIVGTWTATKATFNSTDVVADGGSVTFDVQANALFTMTIQRPGINEPVFTGNLGFDEEWLAVEYDSYPGEYEYYDYELDAGNNIFNIGANSEFDFDNDGTDEFVIFFLDMIRG